MKNFFFKILLFVLSFIPLFFLLIIVWGTIIPKQFRKNLFVINESRGDFLFKRLENIKQYKNVDVLFLGSSHAFRNFDTRIFKGKGIYTFNLGSTGQTPAQSEMFLNKYIDSLKPKLIVFETFPYLFQADNIESELNLILNGFYSVSLENSIKILKEKNIKLINSYLFEMVFKPFKKKFEKNKPFVQSSSRYIEGGYVETNQRFDKASAIPYINKRWKPDFNQEIALDNIIRMTKRKRIKLLLIQSPVTKKCFNYLDNNNEIDSFFSAKGTYYNFNKLLDLKENEFFFDTNHLNQKGVDSFNRAFIRMCLNQ